MNDASVRMPVVAGRFYPAEAAECRAEALGYLQRGRHETGRGWMGGVVPHAGWVCSGAVAGETIATMAGGKVDVVVVFGAIHTPMQVNFAALDSHRKWALPGGESELPMEVQRKLGEKGNLFAVEERLHRGEHAVEVNVPLIQLAWPGAAVLPIEVPVTRDAELFGRKTAQTIAAAGLKAVYLASSDFTHYGPNYRFAPAGAGEGAMEWTKQNDRRVLGLIEQMRSDAIVAEVMQHQNACGGGAIAAMMAACKEMGAKEARILRHTTSYETLAAVAPQAPTNAVGYAAVVVG